MTVYVAETHAEAISAATTKTVLQLSALTRAIKLTEWSLSFDGVTASDVPVQVRIQRQSTAATGSSVSATKRLVYGSNPTTVVLDSVSAEGTAVSDIESYYLTPNGGLLYMSYTEGSEIIVEPTEFIGIVVNAPSSGVNASCWVGWEEV